jgi:hypothetical protein
MWVCPSGCAITIALDRKTKGTRVDIFGAKFFAAFEYTPTKDVDVYITSTNKLVAGTH